MSAGSITGSLIAVFKPGTPILPHAALAEMGEITKQKANTSIKPQRQSRARNLPSEVIGKTEFLTIRFIVSSFLGTSSERDVSRSVQKGAFERNARAGDLFVPGQVSFAAIA